MSRRADLREVPFDLELRRDRAVPLQDALYEALRAAMLGGRLGAGTRLPSSRELGKQLAVARGTVVAVYERLVSEGYISATRGSGTVVSAALPDAWFTSKLADREEPATPAEPRLSRWGKALTGSPFSLLTPSAPRPFRPHIPAYDLFPTRTWAALVARRARDEKLLLSDSDVRGYAPLRAALAEHLRVSRGVRCTTDSIVLVPSVQQVLDLVARLTLDRGDEAWVEDPGYAGVRALLDAAGARVVGVPVDEEGLDVGVGVRRAPKAKLAYVTPGHQAPLGATMSIERRIALLAWARDARALVIEDDYDSEYRYEGRPIAALQGLDRAGVVLHTGTFSKTLLPSFRLTYAVVPDALMDRFLAAKSLVDRYTPPLQQAALADFVTEGHFGRHLRRMREAYAERRAALLDAVSSQLGDRFDILGASAGLEVALRARADIDDRKLERALADAGISAPALSTHQVEGAPVRGLLLGFAAFSPARLRRAVTRMAAVLLAKPGDRLHEGDFVGRPRRRN